MLGEAARTIEDAARYFNAYTDAIDAVGRDPAAGHSISVKLSALHPRYEVAQYDRCVPALTEMLEALAVQAAGKGIALTVDAEESERLEMSLDIIGAVAALPSLKGWDGFGMAVQVVWQARAAGGRMGQQPRPADERAAGQGRLLGQRDQAHAGRGAVGLSAVHAQGGDRRVVPRGGARHARREEHPPGLRQPQRADRRDADGMGGQQPRLRVPAAPRHGRRAVRAAGARAGLSLPHLRAGRRASRSARVSRAAVAGEWGEFELRASARRRAI